MKMHIIDFKLLAVILSLVLFGWVMSFSASLYVYEQYFFYFLVRQSIYIIIGLIIAFFVLRIPIIKLEQYSIKLFLLTLLLLFLVFMPVIGIEINGSYRWLNFGFFTFQPSEMAKLSLILFMAGFLVRQESDIQKNFFQGVIRTTVILFIVGLLLLFETDVGAFLIIAVSVFTMLFVADITDINLKSFIAAVLVGITVMVSLGYLVFFYGEDIIIYFGSDSMLSHITSSIAERIARIMAFLDPWRDPYGKSYQLIQSLIGIGRGGWFGVGLGAGIQKINFLPEAHTDFIFSVIGEELGVFGMLLTLLAFAYIIYRGLIISDTALEQGKKYSAYIAYGISIWLALQVFINIGVNIGILPTKGLTLPLISYGGNSIIFSLISLAILLRVDGENKLSQATQRNTHSYY